MKLKCEEIKSILQNNRFTPQYCEDNGIVLYRENDYSELDTMHLNSYSVIRRAREVSSNKMRSIKHFRIHGMGSKEKYENIAAFFIEKEIVEKISREGQSANFPSYEGCFYKKDSFGEVNELILIQESGDYSLEEITLARREARKRKSLNVPPFTPEEASSILVHIIEALANLQRLKIYHSDVKPSNIIINREKHSIMLTNFGVSKFVKDADGVVDIEDYATHGTPAYNSPEKRDFWQSVGPKGFPLTKEKSRFIPYKCDVWSLGRCYDFMTQGVGASKTSSSSEFSLTYLNNPNWKDRSDASQLKSQIKASEWNDFESFETDVSYIEVIRQRKKEKTTSPIGGEGLIDSGRTKNSARKGE